MNELNASKQFHDEGYFIAKNIIEEKEILEIFQNIFKIYSNKNLKSSLGDGKDYQKEIFHEEMTRFRLENPDIFSEIYDSCQSSCSLTKLVAKNEILEIASELLSCNKIELSQTGNMIRMDVPLDTRNKTAWHQEIAFVRNEGLVLWIPLVGITPEIGPLKILEKSHLEGEITIERNDLNQYSTSRVSKSEIPKTILQKYNEKSIEIELGDALFLIIH